MAREKIITVFTFSELSASAKRRVKDRYAEAFGYAWANESIESLTALAEHFGGKLTDYSIDFFDSTPSTVRFDMPEMEEEEVSQRLAGLGTFNPETLKGHGDCKL